MAKYEIEIPGNTFDAQAKLKAFELMAKQDSDTVTKVADLMKYPKAIEYLKNPPIALKLMLGIK